MAAGVPVVSTAMGIEGIDAVSGQHALVSSCPEEIADSVARVIYDQPLAEGLSREARAMVEHTYSWSQIGRGFREIVESVALRGGSSIHRACR
jgi:glycosyltransferase involved in cell wall biosynthesis